MPRPIKGPHLVPIRKRGWSRAVYYIRWTDSGRSRERSTGESDFARAEEKFAQWLIERCHDNRVGPGRPDEIRIVDALAAYAEEHAPRTAAPQRIGYAMTRLIDWWGDRAVSAIRPETCRRYWRERGAADGTVRRELGVLRAAINHAGKEGRLTPVPYVWTPPKPPGRDRWLTRSEAAALLRAAIREPKVRLYLPIFIVLAFSTGARKEAILSLRWSQIDLIRNRINFSPPGRAQTTKRRPVVPIPRRLAWFLHKAQERATCPFVVHHNGKRLGDIKKGFAAACARGGIEGVSPHTLRHTAGTWMAQRGVDLWQIAGFLGHTHERTTELYGHHHPDFLEQARAALD